MYSWVEPKVKRMSECPSGGAMYFLPMSSEPKHMLVATSKFWTVFYLLSEEKPDDKSCLSEEGIVGLLPKAAMETNNNLKPSSFCLMGSKTTVSEGSNI